LQYQNPKKKGKGSTEFDKVQADAKYKKALHLQLENYEEYLI